MSSAAGIAPPATPASVVTLGAAAQAVDGAPPAPLAWDRNNKDANDALATTQLPPLHRVGDGLAAAPQQRVTLADQDHAILTGLADFSASITQTETAPNPLRLGEHDSFDYQSSQSTSVQGRSQLDRSLAQQQQSQLKASYHAPSKPDGLLALTLDRASQTYNYVLGDDNASSNAALAYKDGALAKATLEQAARQSTRTVKYRMDKQIEDLTIPSSAAHTHDLLDMLAPKKKPDDDERRITLDAANQMIFLQPEPGALPK